MGHLLINELQLPVLGREEDAADQLGLIGLFLRQDRYRELDFYKQLVDVAQYWELEWLRPKQNMKRSTLGTATLWTSSVSTTSLAGYTAATQMGWGGS